MTATAMAWQDGPWRVAATMYSLDGGIVQAYSGAITVSGDGAHSIAYSSMDRAGNAEGTKTLTMQIDTIAPTLTAAATPTNIWPPDHKLAAAPGMRDSC